MSSNENKIKVSASACLTEPEMLDYLAGKLSKPERNKVEKHLLECDLCTDALEGLGKMTHVQVLADIDKWIDQKIVADQPKAKGKEVRFHFNYRIAAVIAFILVAGGALYFTVFRLPRNEKILSENLKPVVNADSIAKNITPQKSDSTSVAAQSFQWTGDTSSKEVALTTEKKASVHKRKADTLIVSYNGNSLASGFSDTTVSFKNSQTNSYSKSVRSPLDSTSMGYAQDNYAMNQEEVKVESKKAATSAAPDEATVPAPSSAVRLSQSTYTLKDNSHSVTENRAAAKTAMRLSPPFGKAKSKAAPVEMSNDTIVSFVTDDVTAADDSTFNDAKRAYEQKQYSDAVKKFKVYIKAHPYSEKANFYYAISNLSNNDAATALTILDKVMLNEHSEFFDAARWYKSLALVKLNRTKEARSLLKEIKKSDSKYSADAENMLKELPNANSAAKSSSKARK